MADKTYNTPTKKPTGKVSNMSISRTNGTRTIVIKWKVGSSLLSKKNEAGKKRTTGLDELFQLMSGSSVVASKYKDQPSEKDTEFSVNLDSFAPSVMGNSTLGSVFKGIIDADKRIGGNGNVKRTHFYPVTGTKLTSVVGKVRCKNQLGPAEWRSATYSFKKPGAPTISDLTQDEETGFLQFTITAYDDKSSKYERYDTQYKITIYDDRDKSTTHHDGSFTGSSKVWKKPDGTSTGDTNIDIEDRFLLSYDEYVLVTVTARSRGFAGDSAWQTNTTSSSKAQLVVGYPSKVTLGEPLTSGNVSTLTVSDKVTIPIKTNEVEDKHPVTGVRLQTLVNVPYDNINRIPGTADWHDTDIVDNGKCDALAINVSELLPDPGNHSWVCVKSWNQFESKFYRFSDPKLIRQVEANLPTADDDDISILQAVSGDDGKSVDLTLGWNADGEDDSTGTEVSWSADKNAWKSTTGPQTYEFMWSDGTLVWPPVGQELEPGQTRVTYQDSAVLHVNSSIEEGTLYWFQARRYMEGEDNTTYGKYSNPVDVMPVSSPSSVVLSCAAYIPKGSDLPAMWTYDSDATQTEWQIITGTAVEVEEHIDDGTQEGVTVKHLWIESGTERVVMRGTDASGSCLISASRLNDFADANGVVPIAVRMGTGGRLTDSEAVSVRIVEPPTISVTVPLPPDGQEQTDVLTAQPLRIGLTSTSKPNVSIVVSTNAGGIGGDGPSGTEELFEGDTVWSEAGTYVWTEDNGIYSHTVELPYTDQLQDNGNYIVTVRATDPVTGLSSEEVVETFSVSWSRKAPAPSPDIEVTPYDEVDSEGVRTRGARIQLVAPETAEETDRYDVYRVTPNGAYLVAGNAEMDMLIDDPYAPYGGSEIGYRVACRTLNGDMEWEDYAYELGGKDLRIDFNNEYVELPWNVNINDSFDKDFEARRKLDGSIDGYWNEGVQRTASLSTDLIRITEEDKAAAVMRLGEYSGPCFVRTPNGGAFMANVSVNSIGGQRRDFALGVTLEATEVGLTGDYMARFPEPDTSGGEEPGEGEQQGG